MEDVLAKINESGLFNLVRDLGVFSGVIWLVQHLIGKSTTKSIEQFKSQLVNNHKQFQNKLDADLEKHKDKLFFETTKATKLHEQQLEAINEIFKRLMSLDRAMLEMTSLLKLKGENPEKEEVDRIKNAGSAYNDFLVYFDGHSILLPEETETLLENIRSDYFDSYSDYTFGRSFGVESKFTYEQSKAAGDRVRVKIKEAIKQLKSNFRKLMGHK